MIVVDDRLSLDALAGRLDRGQVATTWSFHYRLSRAVADSKRLGALSSLVTPDVRRLISNPPEDRLRVLDPRLTTAPAAALAVRHGLNVLAAELFATAVEYDAELRLSAGNVGRAWAAIATQEGVVLTVV